MRLTSLLEATLRFGEFSGLCGQFLCGSAQTLTSGHLLPAGFFELTPYVSGLTGACRGGLLCRGYLSSDSC